MVKVPDSRVPGRRRSKRQETMNVIRKRKVHVGFLTIALGAFVVGLIGYRIADYQAGRLEGVMASRAVLDQLGVLSNRVASAQLAQQEYLLTGKATDLLPYSLAIQYIGSDVVQFEKLTRENAAWLAQAPQFRQQIIAGLAEMKDEVNFRKSPQQAANEHERTAMDAVHSQIDSMQADEQHRLKERTDQWRMVASTTPWVFLIGAVLLGILLRAVYAILQREESLRDWVLRVEHDAANVVETREGADKHLGALASLQRELNNEGRDVQETIRILLDSALVMIHATGGTLELVEGGSLICRAASASMASHLGMPLNPGTTLSTQVMEQDDFLCCDDSQTDLRVDRTACLKVDARSVVALPLRKNGKVIGVFSFISAETNAFGEHDIAALAVIAGLVSEALADAASGEYLRMYQERMDEAQIAAHLGTWEFDCETGKSTWSKELFRLAAMNPDIDEPDYAALAALLAPEDSTRLRTSVKRLLQDGISFALELRRGVSGGTQGVYHATGKPVQNTLGAVIRISGTFRDVTEANLYGGEGAVAGGWRAGQNAQPLAVSAYSETANAEILARKAELEAANARLEALATTDSLTELKNHRAFQERLAEEHQRALRYGIPLSLLMVDVDRFRKYNSAHGHNGGDEVLRHVAAILESTARTTDVVARYGGEEFAILLPETDTKGAVDAAERIRNAVETAAWKHGGVTVSVGAATLDEGTETAGQLLSASDAALTRSKSNGRNCVTHTGRGLTLMDMDTQQTPAVYVRRFTTKLGDARPSRRLLESMGKAS